MWRGWTFRLAKLRRQGSDLQNPAENDQVNHLPNIFPLKLSDSAQFALILFLSLCIYNLALMLWANTPHSYCTLRFWSFRDLGSVHFHSSRAWTAFWHRWKTWQTWSQYIQLTNELPDRVSPISAGLVAEFDATENLGKKEVKLDREFDAVTCMFAIHYFFASAQSLDCFLHNVAINLKEGEFALANPVPWSVYRERIGRAQNLMVHV